MSIPRCIYESERVRRKEEERPMYDYHEDLRIILDNIGHSEEELRKGKQTLLAAVSLLLQREKGQAALPKNVERPYRLRKPSLRVE